MNEKVEMTANKFAMRVAGNALGSSLGFAIMLSPPVASNPYALVVRCFPSPCSKHYGKMIGLHA